MMPISWQNENVYVYLIFMALRFYWKDKYDIMT